MSCGTAYAQTSFGLNYITEMQTNLKGGYNWVNMLRADLEQPIGKHLTIRLATISVAETQKEKLVDDLLTFSNIEEEDLPLALAVAGVEINWKHSTLWAGVRNVNEDYFTSPVTSLFTNSSCGIFPTLSTNFPIANYPMAAMAVDYKLRWADERWMFEASLYNGMGHKSFTGRNNVFRICPKGDGMFGLTTLNYSHEESHYSIGAALHHGSLMGDEGGDDNTEKGKKVRGAVWTYCEQSIGGGMHVLAQASSSLGKDVICKWYGGLGLKCGFRGTTAAIITDYARFADNHEWASELTWRMPCMKQGWIQPAVHLINNNCGTSFAALLRFGYSL